MSNILVDLKKERAVLAHEIGEREKKVVALDAAIAALSALNGTAAPRTAPARVARKQPLVRPRARKSSPGRRNGLQADVIEAMHALAADRVVPVSPKGVSRWLKKHHKRSESKTASPLSARVGQAMIYLSRKGVLVRTGVGLYDVPEKQQQPTATS